MSTSDKSSRLAMLGVLSLLIASGISGQAQQRAVTPNDTLKSPEVLPDGRVVFRVYAPKASAVTLTGDWIERGSPALSLTKDEKGVWSCTYRR
jgi:1,4-alpha-glucan branching enzyme